MYQLATSRAYMFIPVTAPPGVDKTSLPVRIAMRPDDGSEPTSGDWKAGAWMAPYPGAGVEAALLVNPGDYAPGEYMAFVTLTAGSEAPVLTSGRVRVGDART